MDPYWSVRYEQARAHRSRAAYLFLPSDEIHTQDKIHLTPYEMDPYGLARGKDLIVVDTRVGRVAVLICFDVEFPDAVQVVADAGADITPCDVAFPPAGIATEGEWNLGSTVIAEVDLGLLERVRKTGSVLPRQARRPEGCRVRKALH